MKFQVRATIVFWCETESEADELADAIRVAGAAVALMSGQPGFIRCEMLSNDEKAPTATPNRGAN